MDITNTIKSANFKKGTMFIVKDMEHKQVTYGIVLNNDCMEGVLDLFCFNQKLKDMSGPNEFAWYPTLTYKDMDRYLSGDSFKAKISL